MDTPILNAHNKHEYPPMHTAEHIVNGTMVRMFGCQRAANAHVERTKAKLDYDGFSCQLTPCEVQAVERQANAVIEADLPVTCSFATQAQVSDRFDLGRLPEGASPVVRIVRIGDYDECLCAGAHVQHTAQCGHLRISSTSYRDGRLRLVLRLDSPQWDE